MLRCQTFHREKHLKSIKIDVRFLTESISFCATIHLLTVYLEWNNNSELLSWIGFQERGIHTQAGKQQRAGGCSLLKGTQITCNQRQPAQMQWQNFLMICQRNTRKVCVRVCVSGRGGNGSVKMEKKSSASCENPPLYFPFLTFVCPSRRQIPGCNLMDGSHIHLMAIKK